MANHCWNLFSFYGNERVLEQVKQWQTELDSFEPTKDDEYCMRAIRGVFYANVKSEEQLDYGSKWVHQDTDALDPDENQLGFQSAWSSPDELQKHLTVLLYKLDNHILVENNYNIEDGSRGFVYTAINSKGTTCIQSAYSECDYDEFDDSYEAESAMEERLDEYQKDAVISLILEVPTASDMVKKHLPHLNIDWSEYD
jgi:hypothetical protein